jgi:ribosomal protein S7
MPRRREIPKRELAADPVYASTLVTKFINTVMNDGKRSTAEHILYKSFDIIKERTGDDPLKVFKKGARQRQAKSRGEVAPRRRLELSGPGGSESEPPVVAQHPMAGRLRPVTLVTARRCRRSWPTSCSMQRTCAAAR